jgi:hypothetical protein
MRAFRKAIRLQGVVQVACVAILFGVFIPAEISVVQAMEIESDEIIQGTRVHVVLDDQTRLGTFSNSCGSQTLSQSQLQNGAIPSNIIPCPRPGGSSAPPSGDRAGQQQQERARADASFQKALNELRSGDYLSSIKDFLDASQKYRALGDRQNAAGAERDAFQAQCYWNMKAASDENELRELRGEGQDPSKGICREFPDAMKWIATRISSLSAKKASDSRLVNCNSAYFAVLDDEDGVKRYDADKIAELQARLRGVMKGACGEWASQSCEDCPSTKISAEIARLQSIHQEEDAKEKEAQRQSDAQTERERRAAVADGSAVASRAQQDFAANNPLNGGSPDFGAAAKNRAVSDGNAHTQMRVATGNAASPPPIPTVTVQGMQTNQQGLNGGSNFNVPTPCQDLTGAAGCQNSGTSPTVQAQINQAQASLRQANRIRQIDQSYDGKRQAVENLFKAAAAFQAAGDLVQAAEAAEQTQPLVEDLKDDHASNAGPPFAPADFWIGTKYAEYCANANSVERGSAYYGSVCYPDNTRSVPTKEERTALCAQRLKIFKPNSPSDAWLAGEMAKRPLDCNVDGSLMTFREILQWRKAHPDAL